MISLEFYLGFEAESEEAQESVGQAEHGEKVGSEEAEILGHVGGQRLATLLQVLHSLAHTTAPQPKVF
jgi:hypothetical protein